MLGSFAPIALIGAQRLLWLSLQKPNTIDIQLLNQGQAACLSSRSTQDPDKPASVSSPKPYDPHNNNDENSSSNMMGPGNCRKYPKP